MCFVAIKFSLEGDLRGISAQDGLPHYATTYEIQSISEYYRTRDIRLVKTRDRSGTIRYFAEYPCKGYLCLVFAVVSVPGMTRDSNNLKPAFDKLGIMHVPDSHYSECMFVT